MIKLYSLRPEVRRRLSWRKKLIRQLSRHIPRPMVFPFLGVPSGVTEIPFDPVDEAACLIVPNGIACGHGSNLDAQQRLIANACVISDFSVAERFFLKQKLFPKITRHPGRVLSLSGSGDVNYYHWLNEALPRLKYLEGRLGEFDAIYVSRRHAFQRESWRLLGLPEDKLIDSNQVRFLQARELVIPPYIHGRRKEYWMFDWLRSRLPRLPLEEGAPRRLYISRQQAASRGIENADAVEALMRELGFSTIFPETLSWPQQMALFQHAQIVVGPHGAGLTNLGFCAEGTPAIELMPETLDIQCYAELSQAMKLNHHQLPCAAIDPEHATSSDMRVPIAKLRTLLEQLLLPR